MSIDLQTSRYVPTVYLRGAELQAIDELPDSDKDSLTPIFCLKPWATAKLLERSMEKIEEVYPNRDFFLDIDPFYDKEAKRQAQEDYYSLIEDVDDNQNWVDFLDQHPRAFPCLQVRHGNLEAVQNQIDCFTEREKFFLVRLEISTGVNFSEVIQRVCDTHHSNFGFVVDAGWTRDLLSRSNWVDGLVRQIIALRGDSIPVVTTGSSFPNSFSGYEMGESVPMLERLLFSQIVQANNQGRIIYGDWASSRSPSEGGGGGPIPPRLELPTGSSWEIFRADEEVTDFAELADTLASSVNYSPDLNIWATYKIESTRLGDMNGINSPRMAAAVRINMHLYRQLHFDDFDPLQDTDDDYME
ncbi:beta family protein [Tritonibacter scottomollicae]|uniref:beta family protein n=1 Tax=Tritonibacter scottomollicae TaxID=483013 RepID=UPI003AA8AAF5